ncbi:deoxyribonuclease IV [bacterium]|nr:deoxyribonuclease IV [bacterium]MCI0606632.1 deoxyribonuclease IV [bacterium]
MKNTLLLGAHMSIEGGLHRALERGHSIGCTTIQIFTRNNTRWAARDLLDEEIRQFQRTLTQHSIRPVFAHCSYLINLAAGNEFYEKSIAALITEVLRADSLGLPFVVLHPGAHMGKGEDEGLIRVVAAINQVIDATSKAKCKIVIENTAGQGSCVGCKFEHLAYLWTHVNDQNKLGFCIDTCHLFAAGYDIRTEKTYAHTFKSLLNHVPLSSIFAFHLNDSKKELGSRVDRHEHIGKGRIGKMAFRCLLNDSRFVSVPKVLETPKGKDLAEDVINLKCLRRMVKKA